MVCGLYCSTTHRLRISNLPNQTKNCGLLGIVALFADSPQNNSAVGT